MENQRSYSLLTIKSVNEKDREIVGMATTPSTDAYGDIVEPEGGVFTLPLPLLWQHNMEQPIGEVIGAKVTPNGIKIKAKIAQIASPPGLSARLEEAWQSMKSGLVKGLSIGFKPLEYAFLDEGGIRFTKWVWTELSVVTIPANKDCHLQTLKAMFQPPAASGSRRVVHLSSQLSAGVSAKNAFNKEHTMNIAEQIKSFEAKRSANDAARLDIMNKAAEEGRTLDVEESEQYDNLTSEIKAVDSHLARLREIEASQAKQAKPIDAEQNSFREASQLRGGIIKVDEKLAPGIEFARYVKCLAASKGNTTQALEIAKSQYPEQPRIQNVLKAAVNAGTTTDPQWAGALTDYQHFAGDFIDFLRPKTIIGQFGIGGIPSLFRIPFNVRIPGQISGGKGYWVGQGDPNPLTKFDFQSIQLGFAKVANIAVLTDELVRFSNPAADTLVRNALAAAIIERIDIDFIDPNKAEVINVSPASITHGVKAIPSTGNPESDVEAVFEAFLKANLSPTSGVWIMSSMTALALSKMKNPLGQKMYPDLSFLGGTFQGLPAIVSQYAGEQLILVNAQDVYLADDGQVVIDASREASLQMEDSPTNSSKTGTGAQLVSMFQTNSVAIRAERFINWRKRRPEAVAYVSGVNYRTVTGGDKSPK
ncbi:TPA: phage major capsid protein [Proteus mirabilis]|nr:phage major capsid protein [Proteus mirabilis]HEK1960415.1 phage major capsid protein [Proteus mirabilis]HEK2984852.1 phage major capsid protein [Proteus mirabilis]HEK3025022.1 phage major capsid protein [Proteus mirabilis]HEK3180200.1 phage major capsid protein [Proteus mirabilis]